MIWSIPSNREDIHINTPIGAKSIRHIYFENKNGGVFVYKSIPDCISISVDGKQICKNLVMFPFFTSTSEGTRRFLWQDVALNIPLNISNSEVYISGVRNNDFNIVFVLSEEAVDEQKGFDYYESKVLTFKELFKYEDDQRAEMHTQVIDMVDKGDKEVFLNLENESRGFFAYNILLDTDIISNDFPNNAIKLSYQPHFILNLQATDNETVPTDFNLALVSCTNYIAHSKAYFEFAQQSKKTISVKINTLNQEGNLIDDKTIVNLQTILFFKTKKLA